jgi:Flp pilus assembly protein TadD
MDRASGIALAIGLALALPGCAGSTKTAGNAENYDTIMHIANATRGAGDAAGSIALYRKAALAAPNRAEPQLALGRIFLEIGRDDDAVEAYRQAVKLTDGSIEALRGLANAYLAAKRPELAAQPLAEAVEKDPKDAKLLQAMGVAADLSGDHLKAQEFYRRTIAADPTSDGAANDLALSLALTGDYPQAITVLKPLADGLRSTARERQTLSLIYGLSGDRDQAARYARMDLSEAAVDQNLTYFDTLRGLDPDARARAIVAASWNAAPTARVAGIN